MESNQNPSYIFEELIARWISEQNKDRTLNSQLLVNDANGNKIQYDPVIITLLHTVIAHAESDGTIDQQETAELHGFIDAINS